MPHVGDSIIKPSSCFSSYHPDTTSQHFFKVRGLMSACCLLDQSGPLQFSSSLPFIFFHRLHCICEIVSYCTPVPFISTIFVNRLSAAASSSTAFLWYLHRGQMNAVWTRIGSHIAEAAAVAPLFFLTDVAWRGPVKWQH